MKTSLLLWFARASGTATVLLLMVVAFGGRGNGPSGVREWVYLALFPFGFSASYLVGWRWPLFAGCASLACMAASLLVIGRTFDLGPYLIWGLLSIPGVLYVLAGLGLRAASADMGMEASTSGPTDQGANDAR